MLKQRAMEQIYLEANKLDVHRRMQLPGVE
jgi:hypothetical protein